MPASSAPMIRMRKSESLLVERKIMSTINLIAWNNGFGLTRNLQLLQGVLTEAGHVVTLSPLRRGKLRKVFRPALLRGRVALQRLCLRETAKYDINIMLEHVRPEYFPMAHRNVLMPHPEWFIESDRVGLDGIDQVFALTRHAVPIFEQLGKPVRYTGFTSEDRLDRGVPRERAFFHLAGRSSNKGTARLLALWHRHPEWPLLTVVQNPRAVKELASAANIDHHVDYLPDTELKRLQNSHRFHLCPSETEGFGHYLVEAMGIGAAVVTVDAPPMNEMISDDRGLRVQIAETGTQNLATTYFFDEASMEAAVARLLGAEDAELDRLSVAARDWYEQNDRAFRAQLVEAVAALT